MESTEFPKSKSTDERRTQATPARPLPSILRRDPPAATTPIAAVKLSTRPAPAPVAKSDPSRPALAVTAFSALGAPPARPAADPPAPAPKAIESASVQPIIAPPSATDAKVAVPDVDSAWAEVPVAPEPPLTLDGPVELDLAAVEPARPAPKVRTPRTAPEPARTASTFGAGMLQAHKVRAKHGAPQIDVNAPAPTFGAGVLQKRTNRAPLVIMLVLAAAAIAALVLTYR